MKSVGMKSFVSTMGLLAIMAPQLCLALDCSDPEVSKLRNETYSRSWATAMHLSEVSGAASKSRRIKTIRILPPSHIRALVNGSEFKPAEIRKELARYQDLHEALKSETPLDLDAHRALYEKELSELNSVVKALDAKCPQQKSINTTAQRKRLPAPESDSSKKDAPEGASGSGAGATRAIDPRDVYQPSWSHKSQMTQ